MAAEGSSSSEAEAGEEPWAHLGRKYFKKLMRVDPDEEDSFSVREALLLRSLQARYARAYNINAALREVHERMARVQDDPASPVTSEEALSEEGSPRPASCLAERVTQASVAKGLTLRQHSFCITDPHLPDNPIIFASPGFLEVTGYAREEVLGRNCRFLQGAKTDPSVVARMRKALRSGQEITEILLNYRADGEPFWNQLHIAPIFNGAGMVRYFVGVTCDVTALEERSLDEAIAVAAAETEPGTAVKAAEGQGKEDAGAAAMRDT